MSSKSDRLAARAERTQDRADKAIAKGDIAKGIQLGVKALHQSDRANSKS